MVQNGSALRCILWDWKRSRWKVEKARWNLYADQRRASDREPKTSAGSLRGRRNRSCA